MSKIPRSPEEIFEEFAGDLKAAFADDLVSIILYGSGAKGEYVYKKSDLNFLVILTESGIRNLAKAFDLVKKWSKRKVAVPLFVTREYIDSSLDSFPIEFLNMQKHHKLVYGEDVLTPLKIEHKNLRLQCEEQVKGKLLHLREEFLRTMGKKRHLEQLIGVTIPTFASLFTALLALKNIEPPAKKSEILLKTAEEFALDRNVFDQVLAVREKKTKMDRDGLIKLMESYIEEIRKLAMIVDKW